MGGGRLAIFSGDGLWREGTVRGFTAGPYSSAPLSAARREGDALVALVPVAMPGREQRHGHALAGAPRHRCRVA